MHFEPVGAISRGVWTNYKKECSCIQSEEALRFGQRPYEKELKNIWSTYIISYMIAKTWKHIIDMCVSHVRSSVNTIPKFLTLLEYS